MGLFNRKDRVLWGGSETVVTEVSPNVFTGYRMEWGTVKQCRIHPDCTYNSEVARCFKCHPHQPLKETPKNALGNQRRV